VEALEVVGGGPLTQDVELLCTWNKKTPEGYTVVTPPIEVEAIVK
jgi:hypothetical protein